MNQISSLAAAIVLCAACGCQTARTPSLNITPSAAKANVVNGQQIEFEEEKYQLVYMNQNERMELNEYLRPSDTLQRWVKMIGIYHFNNQQTPLEAAAEQARLLKKTCPQARFAILKSQDGKRVSLDYMMWPPDASFMEFNIFIYETNPNGSGLIANQYACRSYPGDGLDEVKKALKRRPELVDTVVSYEFPALENEFPNKPNGH